MATTTRASKAGSQFAFERGGLSEGKFEDGRTAADFRIVMGHVACARLGDEMSEGTAGDGGEGEVNDIRVAE